MPRHRREHVPRHRAQRVTGYPARRARLKAALPVSGTALDGSGLDGANLAGTEIAASVFETGLAGSGQPGTEIPEQAAGTADEAPGLPGAGLTGTGVDDAGPDAIVTAPLAGLTGTLPPRFDGAVAGLAGLAATDAGVLDGAAAGQGPPGRRPPSHSQRRSPGAVSTPARSSPAGQPSGKQGGVARGVLVTPWFAAAAGFVIAASLWIYSPHPQLTYPAIAIGKVPGPCTSYGCGSVDKQGAGSLTINSGQPLRQKSAAHAAAGARDRTAASGLTFGYVVQPAGAGDFELVITVTGKRAVKNWRLAFVLPGDHIRFVFGARWQPAGSDGGTATPSTGVQGQQFGRPEDHVGGASDQGAGRSDYTYGGAHDQPSVIFTIYASGKPVPPADCRFDGASCTFRELSSAGQGGR